MLVFRVPNFARLLQAALSCFLATHSHLLSVSHAAPVNSSGGSSGSISVISNNHGSISNNNNNNSTIPVCGRQHIQRVSKVVGGNDTYDGEFPWTVSVRRNDHHHCGGVIVAARWVLTAAHCLQSRLPSAFQVRIGEYHLHQPDYHSKDYDVEKVVIHHNYTGIIKSSLTSMNSADIALLKTKRDITMNEYAWPVCFPTLDANFAGQEGIVVGWGKRNEKSDAYSDRLQKAKLSIIDNKVCRNWFRLAGRDMQINDQLICAGYRAGGTDACHGDSGGPLLSKIDDQWSVIGVVSTGIGCARPLLPGLYSRVSSYVNWIEKYTSES